MTKRDKPRMIRNGESGWLCTGKLAFAIGPTMAHAYFAWLIREQEWEYIMNWPTPAPADKRRFSLSAVEWGAIIGTAVAMATTIWLA